MYSQYQAENMIVACPACSARYRIDKSKIRGRGAKITCPRCANKFVVYTEQETKDITQQDFSSFGITWRVKKGLGVIQSFSTLAELKQLLETNEVNSNDTLCYDNKTWIPLHSVENLDGFFAEVWKRAEKGEVKLYDVPEHTEPIDDEFDSPTIVITDRDKLLSDLRKELGQEQNTSTPSPVYRTRGRSIQPTYLENDREQQTSSPVEVVRVHDPMHIKPETEEVEPKIPEPPPVYEEEPESFLAQPIVFAATVICLIVAIFALLIYLDLDIPFVTGEPQTYAPVTKPQISVPLDKPVVPNREERVPTKPSVSAEEQKPPSEARAGTEQNAAKEKDEPPPTGEVDEVLGETP